MVGKLKFKKILKGVRLLNDCIELRHLVFLLIILIHIMDKYVFIRDSRRVWSS